MQSSFSHWSVHPQLSPEQFRAARQVGIEPLQCQLLANRGITDVEEMLLFLSVDEATISDPFALIDMERAVLRIERALLNGEHITIHGDYDADGVTSSALLFRAIRTRKQPEAVLDFHIPHRLQDGYGLHISTIDQLKARGTSLIITTDCGSSDGEPVAYAKLLGIDVIITDHHQLPENLPDAYALINPWRTDATDINVKQKLQLATMDVRESGPSKAMNHVLESPRDGRDKSGPYQSINQYGARYLSGVGVAFKLVQALYRALAREKGGTSVAGSVESGGVLGRELDLLDLVSIGTIADVVPLLGENHTLVRMGMQRLNATCNPGLQALMQIARLQPGRLSERDVSFGLAPRINAAGRMNNASIAFKLLTTDDEEEAMNLAAELEQLNIARKRQTEKLMRAVQEQVQDQSMQSVLLLSGQDWHEGIIGLVAGRIAEETQKPVLVLNNDPQSQLSRGSARSPKHFNIIAALRGFGDQLERYGGHAQAAGFTIKSERIEQLHNHLLNWQNDDLPSSSHSALAPKVGTSFSSSVPNSALAPKVGTSFSSSVVGETGTSVVEGTGSSVAGGTDASVDLLFTKIERLTYRTYQTMRQLSPFGAGNPEPIFKMEKLRLLNVATSGYNQQNLRLRLGSDSSDIQLSATYIRGASELSKIKDATHVDIIFKLKSSEDAIRPDIWLKILAIEASCGRIEGIGSHKCAISANIN